MTTPAPSQPLPVRLMYELETQILVKIVGLVVSGDSETYSAKWQTEKLRDLGALNNQVTEIIRKYKTAINEGTAGEIEQTAHNMLNELRRALPEELRIDMTPAIRDSVARWVLSANGDLNYSLALMAENASQAYVNILNKSSLSVITGQSTLRNAIRQAVMEAADQGLPAYRDRAGREWSPEGYTQMVLRSNQRRVATDTMFDAADQLETDLIEVSSHLGARPLCAPYQGQILSRRGETPGFTRLSETSYGKPAGLLGINCGHIIYPYIEGMTKRYQPYPEARNEKAYEQSQQQRLLERTIRNEKRKAKVLTAANDTEGAAQARARAKDASARLGEFIEETGRTRRRDREQIY